MSSRRALSTLVEFSSQSRYLRRDTYNFRALVFGYAGYECSTDTFAVLHHAGTTPAGYLWMRAIFRRHPGMDATSRNWNDITSLECAFALTSCTCPLDIFRIIVATTHVNLDRIRANGKHHIHTSLLLSDVIVDSRDLAAISCHTAGELRRRHPHITGNGLLRTGMRNARQVTLTIAILERMRAAHSGEINAGTAFDDIVNRYFGQAPHVIFNFVARRGTTSCVRFFEYIAQLSGWTWHKCLSAIHFHRRALGAAPATSLRLRRCRTMMVAAHAGALREDQVVARFRSNRSQRNHLIPQSVIEQMVSGGSVERLITIMQLGGGIAAARWRNDCGRATDNLPGIINVLRAYLSVVEDARIYGPTTLFLAEHFWVSKCGIAMLRKTASRMVQVLGHPLPHFLCYALCARKMSSVMRQVLPSARAVNARDANGCNALNYLIREQHTEDILPRMRTLMERDIDYEFVNAPRAGHPHGHYDAKHDDGGHDILTVLASFPHALTPHEVAQVVSIFQHKLSLLGRPVCSVMCRVDHGSCCHLVEHATTGAAIIRYLVTADPPATNNDIYNVTRIVFRQQCNKWGINPTTYARIERRSAGQPPVSRRSIVGQAIGRMQAST